MCVCVCVCVFSASKMPAVEVDHLLLDSHSRSQPMIHRTDTFSAYFVFDPFKSSSASFDFERRGLGRDRMFPKYFWSQSLRKQIMK